VLEDKANISRETMKAGSFEVRLILCLLIFYVVGSVIILIVPSVSTKKSYCVTKAKIAALISAVAEELLNKVQMQ